MVVRRLITHVGDKSRYTNGLRKWHSSAISHSSLSIEDPDILSCESVRIRENTFDDAEKAVRCTRWVATLLEIV